MHRSSHVPAFSVEGGVLLCEGIAQREVDSGMQSLLFRVRMQCFDEVSMAWQDQDVIQHVSFGAVSRACQTNLPEPPDEIDQVSMEGCLCT